MVRVLHIVGRMHRGGIETLIMNIYRCINKEAVQFDFIVHGAEEYAFEDEITKMGGQIYHIERKSKNIIKNLLQIKKIISNNNYNIVHRHSPNALMAIDLAAAFIGGAKIRIAHSHNSKNNMSHIHCLMRPFLYYAANVYFACSQEAGKWMYNNKSFKVINNGIDIEKFEFSNDLRLLKRRELQYSKNNIVIGNIARFNMQKNHIFILEVFSQLFKINENYRLLLIGEGELESVIIQKIKELSLSSAVTILKNRSDVNELLMAIDIFLFPSIFEGLPVVTIEAQASGLPCVVSDSISNEAFITNQIYSISLKESDTYWANKINNIKLGNRVSPSTQIIKAGFNIKEISKWLEDFYIKTNKEGFILDAINYKR